MRRCPQLLQLCLLTSALLLSGAAAKNSRWERVLQAGTAAAAAQAPAAQGPAQALPAQGLAPAPAPVSGPPAVPVASDSLSGTNSTYNQLQALGTYQSDHVAPPEAVQALLNSSAWQTALGSNPYYAPQSFQFTLPSLFFQLQNLGIRQFHFNAWNDPNGTLAKSPAGLKLAGANATLDSRYTYFGYKTFNDPDFDFQSTCITLETCLKLIQSWSMNNTDHIPITIYLEPKEKTLFSGSESIGGQTINQLLASKPGAPSALAKAYPIGASDLEELQNTVYRVFNQSDIVLPGSLLGNASSLQAAVLASSGGSWPQLLPLRGKFVFVMVDSTGKYGPVYRKLFPDLRNATFFLSQPGNGNATVDNSTVFLDYVGALGGGTAASWTNSSANKAVDSLGYQITSVVRQGFIARAAADWQTVEARTDFYNRTLGAIKAGAHFIQTSFPNATGLPAYAFPTSFSNTTVLATNYTVTLPSRLGMKLTSARCDPQTSAGIIANETLTGCGSAKDNYALAPVPAASTASTR